MSGRSRSPPKRRSARLAVSRSPARTPTTNASIAAPAALKPLNERSEFARSIRIYATCVSLLGVALTAVLMNAPPAPTGGVCNDASVWLLLKPNKANIIVLWNCATAYQGANWWFVLGLFQVTYVGLKMFAIPAVWSLNILSGAIFPMPLAQLLNTLGEAVGSSLCYLLSRAIARPVLEYLAPDKLAKLRLRLAEEADFMYTFNIFLRITPFLPGWFINLASPIVGNPLQPFFVGTLFGVQLSVGFIALLGSVLRTAGESGFDMDELKSNAAVLGGVMAMLQLVPLYVIRLQKQRKAKAAAAQATAESTDAKRGRTRQRSTK